MVAAIRRRTSRIHRANLRRNHRRKANRTAKVNRTISCKSGRELLQACRCAWSNFYLSARKRRAAGEFAQSGVTDVLQIFDSDFACVKTIAGQSSQEREEGYALA